MAYDNQFVLCIMHEGAPVREINGSATIPYHKEYKIRLKNKHSNLRAKARVWIDGRKVSGLGDFILQPGQTLDLERFLDSSLDSGNRFKFVPLSDSRVNDPTDNNNGIVKVEFYREKGFTFSIDPINWTIPFTPREGGGRGSKGFTSTNVSYETPTSAPIFTSVNSVSTLSSNTCFVSNDTAGATVEGGNSNQKFSYGDHFETEYSPVTLTIRIKAPKSRQVIAYKRPKKSRHCTNCGESKRRRSDKFCANCGTKFMRRA